MRLLVTTQILDKNHSNLGFFHEWLQRLSLKVKKIYVICLYEGEHTLPQNVEVISLGKEKGTVGTVRYIVRFYLALWRLRGKYDHVFVHMNPEYVILAGILWRLTGKKILLWYVHKAVNMRLRLAEVFVSKIFTASKESFRLRSKKVDVVGHGIPVEQFSVSQGPNQSLMGDTLFLLSVGRISPSKNWETTLQAVSELRKKKIAGLKSVMYLFAGAAIDEEGKKYKEKLDAVGRELSKQLYAGVAFHEYLPAGSRVGEGIQYVYHNSHVLVHTSRTGSMDKVVLEALAAGRIVVTSSEAYAFLAKNDLAGVVYTFPSGKYQELAKTIEKIWDSGILKTLPNKAAVEYVRVHHNLDTLIGKIVSYFES